ncbi:DUF1414 domain-containing protein [Pseudidiomarina sp.]|uniref:DUF1414 domain-containing protein n=1 Tax=Pseudidiomarina sp. TaxID=2081707 RepID=UPI00299DF636|nr:DUF1414 domain-containing protein [Pseudidiomarina sp.]MDX1705462.1 DUF1414 domain-containing protein [Pseudidiomarina sp.]
MLRKKTMPIVSKYDVNTQQHLLEEVLSVVQSEDVPADLALMTLGNAVTHVIQTRYKPEVAQKIAEQFGKVLLQSLTK